jgi:hypothetical protein
VKDNSDPRDYANTEPLLLPTKVTVTAILYRRWHSCHLNRLIQQVIFWDCKEYEDQRATKKDILSENSKKEYPKSVTELLRLEEKRFLQGVSYFISNIPIYIFTIDM